MKILNYIFFKFYKYYSKGDIIPLFSSLIAFNVFLFLILVDTLLVIEVFFSNEFLRGIPSFKDSPIYYLFVLLFQFGLTYFIFLKGKSLEYYENKYKEGIFWHKHGMKVIFLIVVIFFIVSIALMDLQKKI